MDDRARRLVALLKERGMTITTAESCTGGRIAASITAVPGSSQVFPGAIVSYCDRVKHQMLSVPTELLEAYTAVSAPVAEAMAQGAARRMDTSLALSATGLAGPEGDGKHPVGTVFLGLYGDGKTKCEKHVFSGSREEVLEKTVEASLHMALQWLEK